MTLRDATAADLPAVLALLSEDVVGRPPEPPDVEPAHERAFAEIRDDPRNVLLVAEEGGELIACAQVTYIPGLTRHGAERCQVEGVRVRSDRRGEGIGEWLMAAIVAAARERGCGLVQLTTNKGRDDAHRFYVRLGFVASHEGMKLAL